MTAISLYHQPAVVVAGSLPYHLPAQPVRHPGPFPAGAQQEQAGDAKFDVVLDESLDRPYINFHILGEWSRCC